MRIAVLQPGYLPWLGFFDQMMSVDLFVIYDDVQYDRRGWRNRNRVKGPNGSVWLSVPVIQKGKYFQIIKDVKIDNTSPWRKKHIGTIKTLYKKAPYFEPLFPAISQIFGREWEYLWELDMALIGWFSEILGIETPVKLASSLGVDGNKSERLLKICRKVGANEYYSGAAARHYLDLELFENENISVFFQEYDHPKYPQLHGEFLSHLSTLDLVMIATPEAARIISSGSRWVRANFGNPPAAAG